MNTTTDIRETFGTDNGFTLHSVSVTDGWPHARLVRVWVRVQSHELELTKFRGGELEVYETDEDGIPIFLGYAGRAFNAQTSMVLHALHEWLEAVASAAAHRRSGRPPSQRSRGPLPRHHRCLSLVWHTACNKVLP